MKETSVNLVQFLRHESGRSHPSAVGHNVAISLINGDNYECESCEISLGSPVYLYGGCEHAGC